jgi:hypothetical protein
MDARQWLDKATAEEWMDTLEQGHGHLMARIAHVEAVLEQTEVLKRIEDALRGIAINTGRE